MLRTEGSAAREGKCPERRDEPHVHRDRLQPCWFRAPGPRCPWPPGRRRPLLPPELPGSNVCSLSSGLIGTIGAFVILRIRPKSPDSSFETKEKAFPCLPALAVLPTRWKYISGSTGTS